MYIVGIDIAKRKHEAAVIDGEGAVIIKPFSFTNNCSGYNRLLAMLAKAKLPLDEVSFAMEATGHYWLALFTRLQKEGFRVQVINPVQTNSIRNFYIRQAKTDPRDALLIAEVIRFGHFSESTLHPENIYELRELCRGRHAIVSMQADVKRKVVALLDQVFPEYETAFTNMFGDTSMAILQTCPTPKELSEMPLEELCHLICSLIDIQPVMKRTSEYKTEFAPGETDFRERIHPKKDFRLEDPDFSPQPYYQVFQERHGFLPNLSIIDLLFNMGPESLLVLQQSNQ